VLVDDGRIDVIKPCTSKCLSYIVGEGGWAEVSEGYKSAMDVGEGRTAARFFLHE